MATPISSIANRVLPLLIAQAEDSTFAANNVLRAFGAAPNAIKVLKGGGESIIQPVSLGYHSQATEILTGADAYADLDDDDLDDLELLDDSEDIDMDDMRMI